MSYTFSSHGITVQFDDNSKEVLAALQNAVERGLEAIGEKAVKYAMKSLDEQGAVDTGNLKNHVKYEVDGDDVYVGVAGVEYAPYVEFGTGKYSTLGGGTPKETWVYYDELTGEFRIAHPMRARPYILPAARDHAKEYRDILRQSLENA